MSYLTRYSPIQSQLRQLTQAVNDVLQAPRDIMEPPETREEQATLVKVALDLDTVYSSAKLVLKSYHNQLSFINRLPDELLLLIFTHASNNFSRRMFQYMHLTWVCRRWRSLALDCAELWTYLDLGCKNHQIIQEWLSRSKLAKLSVTQGDTQSNDIGQDIVMLEQFIAPQLWRVESLSLKLNAQRLKDIRHFLQQDAPYLKHFHLSHIVEFVPWVPSYRQPSSTSPVRLPRLFNGVAQLYSLSFDMPLIPPWNDFIPLMPGLRELKMTTILHDSERKRPAQEQLLSILSSCPSLETLEFGSASVGGGATPSRITIASVSLPKLWQLTIRGNQDVAILSHIHTPCLRHLSLHFDRNASDALVGLISKRFDLASLKEVRIDGSGNVHGTSEDGEYTLPRQSSSRKLLSIRFPHVGDLNPFTSALLSSSPNISCLILQGRYGNPPSSIRTFRQSLLDAKSVVHLVIAWPSETLSLLKMIEDPSICPRVVKITCVGCESEGFLLGEQLLACAQARRHSPLKEIDVMQCLPFNDFFLKAMSELGVRGNAKMEDPVY